MKRMSMSIMAVAALGVAIGVVSCGTQSTDQGGSVVKSAEQTYKNTGNGAKSGPRYTLNIIAFENCPTNEFKGSNRHMIAVQADFGDQPAGKHPSTISRVNDILLTEGDDFRVWDGNACDADGALFQLPANPCVDANTGDFICGTNGTPDDDPTFQEYEIFLRLVGQPGGGIDVTSCATETGDCEAGFCTVGAIGDACSVDPDCDIIRCSEESIIKVREAKKPRFNDVTKELTTICLDTTGNGRCDTRIELFNPDFEDFFWNWNTHGRPHAQLFFIPIPD